MIKRYTRGQMGKIWSDQSKFETWVRVEAESIRAQVQLGLLQVNVPADLEKNINIIVEEIERIEETTGHDVVAFLNHTSPQLPEELRPYWHRRMTSYDPQDTGLSLQLVESLTLIDDDLQELQAAIKERAFEHKNSVMIGRTHGVHAEPITFGVKLANWHDELKRQRERVYQLFNRLAVGKISGAVGLYTLPPEVEEEICNRLGLLAVIATQVISRDIIAEYMALLANIAGSLAKIATTLRLMQQTEIREIQEPFRKGQKGSSAMPHKRNPVGLENVTGLARLVKSNAEVTFDNQITWHERDISNSAPERVVVPDSSIVLDYILARLTRIIKGMHVFPERMRSNLEATKGLVFSQDIQALIAARSGLPREEAYALAYDVAQSCWETGLDFREALHANSQIREKISEEEIDGCFNLGEKLKYVDYIFKEVFGHSEVNA